MALSPRQNLAYNHLCNLYRPVRTYASDNKPSAESYELAYTGVRCRFKINASADLATVIGRLEGDNYLTLDDLHVAEDQEIDDNWWVLNQTLNIDGTQSTLFGRWWVCRGQPQKFIRSARRQGGKVLIKVSQELNAPLGITA
jgi:hypothetical protein